MNAGAITVLSTQGNPFKVEMWKPNSKLMPKVLLDGGASHNVYYSTKVLEDSVKRQVELAHGTKEGYVRGGDITFLDENVTDLQSETPTIISLGRLIQKGITMDWTSKGAFLVMPNKKRLKVPVYNNCPYANEEVLKLVKHLRNLDEKN